MSKVNIASRTTKADEIAALAQAEAAATQSGSEVVTEDGKKYIVQEAHGLTIKTRIA